MIEFTSPGTKTQDEGDKRDIYEKHLKVSEYYLFDPRLVRVRGPRLRRFRLVDGKYPEIPEAADRMHSEAMGLDLVVVGRTLRMYDPVTGEFLRTHEESELQRVFERNQARIEATARAEAEKRANALETEMERLRATVDRLLHPNGR